MPKTELGYKHMIHLETVTPVAVGDGGTLSPSADYTLDPKNKQCALLLDHKKFETWLAQNPATLTDYLNEVKENAGKKRNTFLFQFLSKYHNPKEAKSYFNAERTIVGNANTVELKTCIKDASRPFIPGSTLKGAFKSVWLHNWLKANPYKIDEIIQFIDRARDEREAQKKIDEIIAECLDDRPTNEKRMQFSVLQISDAYYAESINWYHTKRFKLLKDDKTVVPLFLEAIAPSADGSFSILVESNKLVQSNHRWIKSLESDSLVPFFTQVNQYALDNIAHEMGMTQSGELWDYKQLLRKLKTDITESENQSAWLPVGFGKSNFYQSIGLFIRRRDKSAFEKYIKLFKMGKSPKREKGETDQKELPLTRNLTIEGHLALGWIKMSGDTPIDKKEIVLPDYNLADIKVGDLIQGLLHEKGSIAKVQVSLNGISHILNANGLSKFEKFNGVKLENGKVYQFTIVSIKDNTIKDIKIV